MREHLGDLERLLRAARPAPPASFVRELERSLAERSARRRDRRRPRRLGAGLGLAAGLAVVGVWLAVAGLLPFASSGDRAQAGRECRIAWVERLERGSFFVRGSDDKPRVRYRLELVQRPVRRCR